MSKTLSPTASLALVLTAECAAPVWSRNYWTASAFVLPMPAVKRIDPLSAPYAAFHLSKPSAWIFRSVARRANGHRIRAPFS